MGSKQINEISIELSVIRINLMDKHWIKVITDKESAKMRVINEQ